MWRPTMILLCLIASLAGTPLRQAEAADDFARWFAEFDQGTIIETVDGGVGDDVEMSIRPDVADPLSLPAICYLAMADDGLTPLVAVSTLPSLGDSRRGDPPGSLPIGSALRFSWLQRFRF